MNTEILRKAIRAEVKRQLNEARDFPRTDFYKRAYETASRMELKKFDDTIVNLAKTWMSDGLFDIADVTDILTERMNTVLRNYQKGSQ